MIDSDSTIALEVVSVVRAEVFDAVVTVFDVGATVGVGTLPNENKTVLATLSL